MRGRMIKWWRWIDGEKISDARQNVRCCTNERNAKWRLFTQKRATIRAQVFNETQFSWNHRLHGIFIIFIPSALVRPHLESFALAVHWVHANKNCDRAKRGAAISAISVCTVHNTKRQKIKTFSFTLILCSLFFHPFSDSMTLTLCLFFFLLLNSVALARQFARSFSAFSSAFHGVCKRCHWVSLKWSWRREFSGAAAVSVLLVLNSHSTFSLLFFSVRRTWPLLTMVLSWSEITFSRGKSLFAWLEWDAKHVID